MVHAAIRKTPGSVGTVVSGFRGTLESVEYGVQLVDPPCDIQLHVRQFHPSSSNSSVLQRIQRIQNWVFLYIALLQYMSLNQSIQ